MEQLDTYYPYGLPTMSFDSKVNRYLYGEKEIELRQGLNTYDFLARTYAPDECRFWQPDPEATTYHGISPYVYCGADPINFIDPTGKIIQFADSTDTNFIEAFNDAVNYLRENRASYRIDKLIESKVVCTLKALPSNGQYFNRNSSLSQIVEKDNKPVSRVLLWDYTTVIETDTGYFLSPAETLSHEADHLYRSEIDWLFLKVDFDTNDVQFDNKEDRRVILGSEQIVAHKLGRLPAKSTTRTSHGMKLMHKAIGVRGEYIENEGFIIYGKKK